MLRERGFVGGHLRPHLHSPLLLSPWPSLIRLHLALHLAFIRSAPCPIMQSRARCSRRVLLRLLYSDKTVSQANLICLDGVSTFSFISSCKPLESKCKILCVFSIPICSLFRGRRTEDMSERNLKSFYSVASSFHYFSNIDRGGDE